MKNTGILIVVLLLAAAGLFVARHLLRPGSSPGLSSSISADAALPSNLPALEQSDDRVRAGAGPLSASRAFKEWLKLDALIPRLTAAMNRIASGSVPRDIFAAFAPRGKFQAVKRDGKAFIDPASYARYDGFASMVQSIDAAAGARVFEELLPLFDVAQRALGERNASARAAFLAAVHELEQAPVVPEEIAVKEGKKGIGWDFAEERLENLSPAQKQLLRMGPKNQAAVQAKLRGVAAALDSGL